MSQTNEHNAEASKSYFDQWHLYQQVIQNDYMSHSGIAKAINQSLAKATTPLNILDLGCGDASAIATIFEGLDIAHYTGVDIAGPALTLAADNLSTAGIKHRLVEADFADYVKTATTSAKTDIIMIGFALHHLHSHEKQALLNHCARHLADNGQLIIYDIFKREGECLENYLDAYTTLVQNEWTALSTDAVSQCVEHVRACDFPETLSGLAQLANNAGIASSNGPIFKDEHKLHIALSLSTV